MPFFKRSRKEEPGLPTSAKTTKEKTPIPPPSQTSSPLPRNPSTAIPTRTKSSREDAILPRTPTRTFTRQDSTKPTSPQTPQRPGLERRGTTVQTRYVDMLLSLDRIPRLHNILASLSTWILLAGYLVFPATFTSLQNNKSLNETAENGTAIEQKFVSSVRNAPILYIAGFSCGIGTLGCIWLWYKHRNNYVWVINRIFLPAFMNSLAGLISTIVNVYSAQKGKYSVTAMVTAIVTGACAVVTAGLFLIYNNLALERVKRKHEREMQEGSYTGGSEFGVSNGRGSGEGARGEEEDGGGVHAILDKVKRKAHEPGLEPSSVV